MTYQAQSYIKRLWCAAAILLASAVLVFGWRWYWQPVAKINPTHWANKAIRYHSANHVQALWLHRRHAASLNLAQQYMLYADGRSIAVRLTAVSYPTSFPTAVRVDFELINTADTVLISGLQNAVLQRPP